MRRLVWLSAPLTFLWLTGAPAVAQSASNDQQAIQSVIQSQIDAFRKDDGATAYSFASPSLHRIFPSPEIFMNMVRQGYPAVYHPRSYTFGALETKAGQLTQTVEFVGPDGDYWTALYTMGRQEDGSWKITGCFIVKSEGKTA